jgi:CheY-like chemotaxis protein
MRVLIAEDEPDTAMQYQIALEEKNHDVIVTENGEECLKVYYEEMKRKTSGNHDGGDRLSPFDVVVLDYRMPRINGMEVAKEILTVNPKQRIIFASAYVKETLANSVRELRHVVELMQKPFELDSLVDTIEDREIQEEMEELNEYLQELKEFNLTQEQIADLLESLRKIQKGRTF